MDVTVPGVELQAAWTSIMYMRPTLETNHIIVEGGGDSAIVTGCLQG